MNSKQEQTHQLKYKLPRYIESHLHTKPNWLTRSCGQKHTRSKVICMHPAFWHKLFPSLNLYPLRLYHEKKPSPFRTSSLTWVLRMYISMFMRTCIHFCDGPEKIWINRIAECDQFTCGRVFWAWHRSGDKLVVVVQYIHPFRWR